MDLGRVLAGLDAQQHHAVTVDAAPLAIIAAAGSGKTRVLTARIAHRIATGSAEPAHVLAITFTRDAAAELRRRLRRLDVRERIEAGTFHALALRLLRDRALARNEPPPVIAQDRTRLIREALTELKSPVPAGVALGEIDWARARRVAPERYADAVRAERRRTPLPPERFVQLRDRYEAVKRSRGVLDFDDLLERCVVTMEHDPTFAEVVRWRFRHLFLDEAQDLNPLQHALLEVIRSDRPDLCLVGDPRQAIYGWNGSDPRFLDDVTTYFPGVEVVHLSGNYRCSDEVVAAGRAVLTAARIVDDSESRAGPGPAIEIRRFATEHDEAAAVADAAGRWLAMTASTAVLTRTNEQLSLIADALTARHVPVRRAAGRRPVDVVVAEVARLTGREQLAAWADEQSVSPDPVRRRVAEELDRYLSSGDQGSWRAWVERADPFGDLADDAGPAVELSTFHAAKGREWEAVVVAGVEVGLVPHASATSVAQRAEETRLLYVAVTRAARRLLLTAADSRAGRTAGPSPLLAGVEQLVTTDRTVAPPAELRRRPVDPYAALREWREGVARVAGIPPRSVCTDRVLRSLHDDPPGDLDELARRLSITPAAARRLRPLPGLGPAPDVRTPRASSR